MNAPKNFFHAGLLAFFLSPFFLGCGSGDGDEDANDSDTSAMDGGFEKTTSKAQNIFYAIPSPIELAQLIQKAGAVYNKDLLNPIENKDKYMTNAAKALNLGVYGADLSYTSIFDDNAQESLIYLKCTQTLASALGVGSAFNEQTVDRIQANTNKKDSLLTIISDSYMTTDELLKESQRESASALVIAGGFVEALFLGTQLAKLSQSPDAIIARIAEQKGTLDNVISLLNDYQNDPGVAGLLSDMASIKEIYNKVIVTKSSEPDVKTNPGTKITTIGGKISYSMTPEVFEALAVKSAEVRNKIISQN